MKTNEKLRCAQNILKNWLEYNNNKKRDMVPPFVQTKIMQIFSRKKECSVDLE